MRAVVGGPLLDAEGCCVFTQPVARRALSAASGSRDRAIHSPVELPRPSATASPSTTGTTASMSSERSAHLERDGHGAFWALGEIDPTALPVFRSTGRPSCGATRSCPARR